MNRLSVRGAGLLLVFVTRLAWGVVSSATILVTNANDSGPGSFRQAILDSNASGGVYDTIEFNIPGAGVHTIVLASPLPDVSDPVFINGQTQPGYSATPLIELNGAGVGAGNPVLTLSGGGCEVRALAINRGPDAGIRIQTNGGNKLLQNVIGTDPSGTIPLGNGSHGIVIDDVGGNRINDIGFYGTNVISGNGMHGILITGASAGGNEVRGNVIGTDPGRRLDLGNAGVGIMIQDAARTWIQDNDILRNAAGGVQVSGNPADETLIDNNRIAHNGGPGVSVAPTATRVHVRQNNLYFNTGIEIDLNGDGRTPNDAGDVDAGANNLQNFPILKGLTFTSGTARETRYGYLHGEFEGTPLTTYTFELMPAVRGSSSDDPHVLPSFPFMSYSLDTDSAGRVDFSLDVLVPPAATHFTSTATDPAGNTSELSAPLRIPDLEADSSACGASGAEGFLALALAMLLRSRRRSAMI